MTLDPDAAGVMDLLRSVPPVDQLTPVEARARTKVSATSVVAVGTVTDWAVPGPAGEIAVRIYHPSDPSDPRPVVVFLHGGGWVICGLDSHDDLCRSLCARSGCAVVAVDYRLAPEDPFPAAPTDCMAALSWVVERGRAFGLDASRLAVAGDSAGGNLAAALTLMARDGGGPPIAFQALLYPVTDFDRDTPSFRRWGEGLNLTRSAMRWYDDHYVPTPADRRHPYAAPLQAPDLTRLPAALVITAEHDPLASEGDRYAERLAAAGVPTVSSCYPGMFHGFVSWWRQVARADRALDDVAGMLRWALAGSELERAEGPCT